jgi:hypothetical protein
MSKLPFEPAITCLCDQFGTVGKYQNWTKSTKTELSQYRFLEETDRHLFSKEPNYCGNQSTKPIDSVLPNAQADLSLIHLISIYFVTNFFPR